VGYPAAVHGLGGYTDSVADLLEGWSPAAGEVAGCLQVRFETCEYCQHAEGPGGDVLYLLDWRTLSLRMRAPEAASFS